MTARDGRLVGGVVGLDEERVVAGRVVKVDPVGVDVAPPRPFFFFSSIRLGGLLLPARWQTGPRPSNAVEAVLLLHFPPRRGRRRHDRWGESSLQPLSSSFSTGLLSSLSLSSFSLGEAMAAEAEAEDEVDVGRGRVKTELQRRGRGGEMEYKTGGRPPDYMH